MAESRQKHLNKSPLTNPNYDAVWVDIRLSSVTLLLFLDQLQRTPQNMVLVVFDAKRRFVTPQRTLPSRKITSQWTIPIFYRKYIFKWSTSVAVLVYQSVVAGWACHSFWKIRVSTWIFASFVSGESKKTCLKPPTRSSRNCGIPLTWFWANY